MATATAITLPDNPPHPAILPFATAELARSISASTHLVHGHAKNIPAPLLSCDGVHMPPGKLFDILTDVLHALYRSIHAHPPSWDQRRLRNLDRVLNNVADAVLNLNGGVLDAIARTAGWKIKSDRREGIGSTTMPAGTALHDRTKDIQNGLEACEWFLRTVVGPTNIVVSNLPPSLLLLPYFESTSPPPSPVLQQLPSPPITPTPPFPWNLDDIAALYASFPPVPDRTAFVPAIVVYGNGHAPQSLSSEHPGPSSENPRTPNQFIPSEAHLKDFATHFAAYCATRPNSEHAGVFMICAASNDDMVSGFLEISRTMSPLKGDTYPDEEAGLIRHPLNFTPEQLQRLTPRQHRRLNRLRRKYDLARERDEAFNYAPTEKHPKPFGRRCLEKWKRPWVLILVLADGWPAGPKVGDKSRCVVEWLPTAGRGWVLVLTRQVIGGIPS